MVIWRTAIPSHCSDQVLSAPNWLVKCRRRRVPASTHVCSPCAFEKCYLFWLPEALRNSTALVVGSGEHTCIRVFDWYVALQILLLWFAQAGKTSTRNRSGTRADKNLAEKDWLATIFSNGVLCKSRKLDVLAEVALALARNRQAPGPLETLKLSSYCRPPPGRPRFDPPLVPARAEIFGW